MSKTNYKKDEIESIILKAQNGDTKALEELIRRIQKKHLWYILPSCRKKR